MWCRPFTWRPSSMATVWSTRSFPPPGWPGVSSSAGQSLVVHSGMHIRGLSHRIPILCSTTCGGMVPVKALSGLMPNVPDHILSLISASHVTLCVSHVTLHPLSLQGGSATPIPVVSKLQPACDFVWFPRVQCRVHMHGFLNAKVLLVDHFLCCV